VRDLPHRFWVLEARGGGGAGLEDVQTQGLIAPTLFPRGKPFTSLELLSLASASENVPKILRTLPGCLHTCPVVVLTMSLREGL
jgi:hypothetical protein